MRRRSFKFAGLVSLIVASTPVLAQPTQTVDGAQRFLKLAFENTSYQSSQLGVHGGHVPTGPWTYSVPIAAGCETVLILHTPQNALDLQARIRAGSTYPPYPASVENRLDWRTVGSVSSGENFVVLTVPAGRLDLYLQSRDMTLRVAYAMEFLRTECDPTRDTGF
jgi:hypothetical protein